MNFFHFFSARAFASATRRSSPDEGMHGPLRAGMFKGGKSHRGSFGIGGAFGRFVRGLVSGFRLCSFAFGGFLGRSCRAVGFAGIISCIPAASFEVEGAMGYQLAKFSRAVWAALEGFVGKFLKYFFYPAALGTLVFIDRHFYHISSK